MLSTIFALLCIIFWNLGSFKEIAWVGDVRITTWHSLFLGRPTMLSLEVATMELETSETWGTPTEVSRFAFRISWSFNKVAVR